MRFLVLALALLVPVATVHAETCGINVTTDAIENGCLPALTHDRATLAVPMTNPDAGRGYPNLTVRFMSLTDPTAKPRDLVVATTDEWEKWDNDRPTRARDRVVAVDKQLGAGFIRLSAAENTEQHDAHKTFKLALGGYDLIGQAGTITLNKDGFALGSVHAPGASGKGACKNVNTPFVGGLFVDQEHRVAAVRFDFHGNDSCAEGTPQWAATALIGAASSSVINEGAALAIAANDRGMKHYKAKQWADALREFRAAIAADASHVKSHYNLACVAALSGDNQTALEELRWLSKSQDPAAKEKLAKAAKDPDLKSLLDNAEARTLLGLAAAATTDTRAPTESLWENEAIGPIKINMSSADLIKALGAPKKKSPIQKQEADGAYVSNWDYDNGLVLQMAGGSKKGATHISMITVNAPSKLATRGIVPGSTVAELTRAFPKALWSADDSDDTHVTIGSPYGGIIFSLENKRVTTIFFGAAAE